MEGELCGPTKFAISLLVLGVVLAIVLGCIFVKASHERSNLRAAISASQNGTLSIEHEKYVYKQGNVTVFNMTDGVLRFTDDQLTPELYLELLDRETPKGRGAMVFPVIVR